MILTHCHADHDSGVFQKIFESSKVELITTQTIMSSFLRKHSAMTGMPSQRLATFFDFRPVLIGAPMHINGAEFHFFHSLHTIPTIGFTCRYADKSIYLSSDTYWDPEKMMEKFVHTGCMSQERFGQLTDLDLKFGHDLALHEVGPPRRRGCWVPAVWRVLLRGRC